MTKPPLAGAVLGAYATAIGAQDWAGLRALQVDGALTALDEVWTEDRPASTTTPPTTTGAAP
ncbi:MAG: hypothetical protein JWN84_4566 [Nocardioides sp.]|nr:hypothetical protein [Nocardioides sp.]